MAYLCRARLLVALVPFHRWRDTLGSTAKAPEGERFSARSLAQARRLARHVDRAAAWLPFATKCLPRAMALSWMLRARNIEHILAFAVRPAQLRQSSDNLHAWVEVEGIKVIGDLPGPWFETLRLGS